LCPYLPQSSFHPHSKKVIKSYYYSFYMGARVVLFTTKNYPIPSKIKSTFPVCCDFSPYIFLRPFNTLPLAFYTIHFLRPFYTLPWLCTIHFLRPFYTLPWLIAIHFLRPFYSIPWRFPIHFLRPFYTLPWSFAMHFLRPFLN